MLRQIFLRTRKVDINQTTSVFAFWLTAGENVDFVTQHLAYNRIFGDTYSWFFLQCLPVNTQVKKTAIWHIFLNHVYGSLSDIIWIIKLYLFNSLVSVYHAKTLYKLCVTERPQLRDESEHIFIQICDPIPTQPYIKLPVSWVGLLNNIMFSLSICLFQHFCLLLLTLSPHPTHSPHTTPRTFKLPVIWIGFLDCCNKCFL